MPTISSFYGIIIMMYLYDKEHNPPHIHAFYGEYEASYTIKDGKLLFGKFPKTGEKLVKKFIEKYRKDLQEMWDTGNYKKLPALN